MPESFLPRGLIYVNWDFGLPEFDGVEFDFTVTSPIEKQPGMYFQLYDANIGGVGQYFGLQSDVAEPTQRGHVGRGHGLLASRWGDCTPADAKIEKGGWMESASHEGKFVGVRHPFAWGPGEFHARLAIVASDKQGDWFALRLTNVKTKQTTSAGSVRFPRGDRPQARLRNGGGTWVECYSGAKDPAGLPLFDVTITRAVALVGDDEHAAMHARSTYTKYPGITQVDVACDRETRHVRIRCGRGVEQRHPPGQLF